MRLAIVVFLVAGQLALASEAQGPPAKAPADALAFEGQCQLDQLDPSGFEHFSFKLQIGNRLASPIELRRAEVFLASRGGFATSLGELIAKNHSVFGIGPRLAPASRHKVDGLKLVWSMPVTHVLFALETVDKKATPHYSLEQLAIGRPGFPHLEKLPAQSPLFIALQEPIEVLPMTSGEFWLPIIGQLFNTF